MILPKNLEVERQVLGSLIQIQDIKDVIAYVNNINKNWFSDTNNKQFFSIIKKCVKDNILPSIISLPDYGNFFDEDVAEFSMDLMNEVVNIALIDDHIRKLKEKGIQRIAVEKSSHAMEAFCNANFKEMFPEYVNSMIELESSFFSNSKKGTEDKIKSMKDEMEENKTRIDFGFVPFKDVALWKKQIWSIGARPSVGKTAIALKMAYEASKQGHPIVIFCKESSAEEILRRIGCMVSEIPYVNSMNNFAEINKSKVDIFDKVMDYLKEIKDRFFVFGLGEFNNLIEMESLLRNTGCEIDILIADYLQDFDPLPEYINSKERIQLSANCQYFKDMIGRNNCAGILLSQFNRESVKGSNRPTMRAFKSTGKIEEISHIMSALHAGENMQANGRRGIESREFYSVKTRLCRPFQMELELKLDGANFRGIWSGGIESF